jgi:hypothetical protein
MRSVIRRRPIVQCLSVALALTATAWAFGPSVLAAETEPAVPTTATLSCVPGEQVALPPPTTGGGMPLLTALANRHSSRAFAAAPLPLPMLSDLLWAANGVNRHDSGKRTAATARN